MRQGLGRLPGSPLRAAVDGLALASSGATLRVFPNAGNRTSAACSGVHDLRPYWKARFGMNSISSAPRACPSSMRSLF